MNFNTFLHKRQVFKILEILFYFLCLFEGLDNFIKSLIWIMVTLSFFVTRMRLIRFAKTRIDRDFFMLFLLKARFIYSFCHFEARKIFARNSTKIDNTLRSYLQGFLLKSEGQDCGNGLCG